MMLSEKECIKAISPVSKRMEKPESGIRNPEPETEPEPEPEPEPKK